MTIKIYDYLILFFLFFVTSTVLTITFSQLNWLPSFQIIDILTIGGITVISILLFTLVSKLTKRPVIKSKKRKRKNKK